MADVTYDVAIIGSGPGGYTAAFRAARYGLKTVLIEKQPHYGGTCLHVGCIPTKALLFQAEIYDYIQRAGEFGIQVTGVKLDWARVIDRKREVVKKHAQGLALLMKKNKVGTIQGFGRLVGRGTIEVDVGKNRKSQVKAKNIILATGSDARLLPGLEEDGQRILTNTSVMELKQVPKSMIVIGAGAWGWSLLPSTRLSALTLPSWKCCPVRSPTKMKKFPANSKGSSRSAASVWKPAPASRAPRRAPPASVLPTPKTARSRR